MILVKLASRGRKDWFTKTFHNIYNTVEGEDFKVLITADLDDPEMNNDTVRELVATKENAQIIYGVSKSKIHAINRDMECAGHWDLLVNLSDDMVITKKGWNKTIEARQKEFFPYGDCFLHFPDGYVNEALPTMSIMDRKYFNRTHSIYHWEYKSFSSDAEAFFVAQMLGRYKYFDDHFFLHQHPVNTPAPHDNTYTVNSRATEHDLCVYWKRLNNYFYVPITENTPIPFQEFLGRNTHLYETDLT